MFSGVLFLSAFVITTAVPGNVTKGVEEMGVVEGGLISLHCPHPTPQPVHFFKKVGASKVLLHSNHHHDHQAPPRPLQQPSAPTQQTLQQQHLQQQQQLPQQHRPNLQNIFKQPSPPEPQHLTPQPNPSHPPPHLHPSHPLPHPHPSHPPPHLPTPPWIYQKGDRMLIEGVGKSDGGDYGCEVVRDGGVDDVIIASVAILAVARVVSFANVTSKAGEGVVVECVVEGADHVTINSSTHPSGVPTHHPGGRVGVVMVDRDTYELHIDPIHPSDAGIYTCVASSHLSSHVSEAFISVLYSPTISATPFHTYTWLHHTTNFTCPFSAHPPPTIRWSMEEGGTVIEGGADDDTFKIFTGETSTSLQITVHETAQTWVYKRYTCALNNPLGSAQRTFTLSRASTPNVPVLASKTATATQVRLLVTPPDEDGGVPVVGYVLYKQDVLLMHFNLSGEVVMEGLTPNTMYHLSVRARNQVGMGVPLSLHVKTARIATPHIEMDSHHDTPFPFHHTISWRVVSDGGKPISNYQVFVRQLTPHSTTTSTFHHSQPPPDDSWTSHSTPGTNGTFVLRDLKAGTAYEVVMRARNEVGWSDFTPTHFFTTRYATPEELQSHLTHHFSLLLTILIFILILLLTIIIITALVCRHRWLPAYPKAATAADKQSLSRRSHCSTNSSRPSNNTTPIHHSISPITTQNSNTTLLLRHSNSATPIQRSNASTPTLLPAPNHPQPPSSHHSKPHTSIPPELPPRNPSPHQSSHHSTSHQSNPRHSNSHQHKLHHLPPNHSSSLPITSHHRSRSPHSKAHHPILSSKLPSSSSHHSSPHRLLTNLFPPFKPPHPRSSNHSSPHSSTPHHSSTPKHSTSHHSSPHSSIANHSTPHHTTTTNHPTPPSSSHHSDHQKRRSAKDTSLPPVPV